MTMTNNSDTTSRLPIWAGISAGMWVSIILLVLMVVLAVFGPMLVDPDSVAASVRDRLKPPGTVLSSGSVALLGTDVLGRDMLADMLLGLRTSLMVAGGATVLSALIGIVLGLAAGYWGGWVDVVISRAVDIEIVFPVVLLAIIIAGLVGPSLTNLIIILAVTRWVVFCRVARASALTLRERDYVKSAQLLGVPDFVIIWRHILPFLLASCVSVATLEVAAFVMAEAGLSYLGIGLPTSAVSLGKTIAAGRDYMDTAWWIAVFPGLVLVFLVVLVGVLGDQLSKRSQDNLS